MVSGIEVHVEMRAKMQHKVSVIVPVYNAEDFLAECIESILGQDYEELELLLVDDGSRDGSGRICEEYAAASGKIRLLRQENSGASAARNAGLRQAEGEFIVFVDADDYLPGTDIVSHMVCEIEAAPADVLVGDYERLWDGRRLAAGSCGRFSGFPADGGAFRFQGFFSVGTLSYIWGKMYRRTFLECNGIQFSQFQYGEDKLFNFECYIQGAKYAFLQQPVYVYRKNERSVSYAFRGDSVEGWMGIADRTERLLREKGLGEKYGDLVACTIFFAAFFDGKMYYQFGGKKLSRVKKVLKKYGSEKLARFYFSELCKGKHLKMISPFIWKVMIWGFACGMRFHCYRNLSFGIKLLIDLRVDERLSDTGLRED